MSPHDLLHHYCDLNEIPFHQSWDKVIDYIISNPDNHINYQTPYGRIFNLIYQYVQGTIDLEAMMISGDMGHEYDLSVASHNDAQCLVIDSLIVGQISGGYDTVIEIQ